MCRYNTLGNQLSGRGAAQVIGRDFFRDIAPCTNFPGFRGRFAEGVRRGKLSDEFRFVFGFSSPRQVRVEMADAATPGRYWLKMFEEPLPAVPPAVDRPDPEATVAQRLRAEAVDTDLCEREPIHIPGAVQPHVVLLCIEASTQRVRACSANWRDLLVLEEAPIGRRWDEFLPAEILDAVCEADGFRTEIPLGPHATRFALTCHDHDDRRLLEIERLFADACDFEEATTAQAHDALRRIRRSDTVEAGAQLCADAIREMTRFDRVLVYRFDPDWNGEAIAESMAEGAYAPLLGMRFPASDIPAQARELYRSAPPRFVVDRDAVPAALIAHPSANARPVDLSCAYSRALSPVHLEYQRNLGVNGSMSVSIMVDGKLWGLVIGHHRAPHYVDPDTRALVSVVTDGFSLRADKLTTDAAWREQQLALEHQNALLHQLAGAEEVESALTSPREGGHSMADMFDAGGAALVRGEEVSADGEVPSDTQIVALARWLRGTLEPGRRLWSSHRLAVDWPDGGATDPHAAGVLAAFTNDDRDHLLLWFRPEVAHRVSWGGDPNKAVQPDRDRHVILPRRSFERWVEERHGESVAWQEWQCHFAGNFAEAVEGVVLRQGRKIDELSRKEAELVRALELQRLMGREIDHRVRNSLQIVGGMIQMQARSALDDVTRLALNDTYSRVMSVARVHNSLEHVTDDAMVDLGETLRQLCSDMEGVFGSKLGPIHATCSGDLSMNSKRAVAFALIASELVTNARKYAYPGQEGPIDVCVREEGGVVTLEVCDQGVGLSDDWQARPRTSGGLGMRVVHGMLRQIGGTLSSGVGRNGRGTCFRVSG